MFPLFTHLSADYRLHRLVNNVAIHIYAHDYIGRKYPFTQFATIKSPTDAMKFSNTIQLSPKSILFTEY